MPSPGREGDRGRPRARDMTIQRMDNAGIVVDDLKAAIAFFVQLGMELEIGTEHRPRRL